MIQAHNPMIIGDSKQVAVTFQSGAKILSLSLDNSLGRMETLRRGDVRLMIEGEDETRIHELAQDIVDEVEKRLGVGKDMA